MTLCADLVLKHILKIYPIAITLKAMFISDIDDYLGHNSLWRLCVMWAHMRFFPLRFCACFVKKREPVSWKSLHSEQSQLQTHQIQEWVGSVSARVWWRGILTGEFNHTVYLVLSLYECINCSYIICCCDLFQNARRNVDLDLAYAPKKRGNVPSLKTLNLYTL